MYHWPTPGKVMESPAKPRRPLASPRRPLPRPTPLRLRALRAVRPLLAAQHRRPLSHATLSPGRSLSTLKSFTPALYVTG